MCRKSLDNLKKVGLDVLKISISIGLNCRDPQAYFLQLWLNYEFLLNKILFERFFSSSFWVSVDIV
jgi:hypothetical protein